MSCVEGIDEGGRSPGALYDAAAEALREAQTPEQTALARKAMTDAFNPAMSDQRAVLCNSNSGGFKASQACTARSAPHANVDHLFICRSPLLAFNFWDELRQLRSQGVTLTPTIASEICAGMRAGSAPQCLKVEGTSFKPIASGWGGALALTDGETKAWFHNPDDLGWVHPEYYVQYVNRPSN